MTGRREAEPTIMVLGGYGNAGLRIARLVLAQSSARVVLAGRDEARATATAAALEAEFGAGRAAAARVDAADTAALRTELVDTRAAILVVAASTISHTREVATAALDAGADYFDVQISSTRKRAALEGLLDRIEREGRCFVTDGGFRPGIPAAMIRYAAGRLVAPEAVQVASTFQVDWGRHTFSDSTAEEFADELQSYSSLVLVDGEWRPASMREMPEFDFGEPFGRRRCTPMFMEELRGLPETMPTLRRAGFYSGGFGPIVDYVVMPPALLLVKLLPMRSRSIVGRLFKWGLVRHTAPPYGAVLRLDAVASDARRVSMTVWHEDAYALTATAAAACLLQYLDGALPPAGLRCQAMAVEPGRFFGDLARLGATVTVDGETLRPSLETSGAPMVQSAPVTGPTRRVVLADASADQQPRPNERLREVVR